MLYMTDELDEVTAGLLTSRYFGQEPAYDWAIQCLEAGFDSPSLRILASMNAADSGSEIEDMVRRVYEEQGWTGIEPELYLLLDARLLAKDILEGRKDAIEGSKEMYTLLQATDGHSALSAWWDIDEALFDRDRFKMTGETGYFYTDDASLIDEINESCADLVLQADTFRGELPETSFEFAAAFLRKFLVDQDHPGTIFWVFAEDVLCTGTGEYIVRVPLPTVNRKKAKECFELGKERGLGLAMHAFCTLGMDTLCYVMLPTNEDQSQRALMNPKYIKFSTDAELPEARASESSIRWHIQKLSTRRSETPMLFLIPSRQTLLPRDPTE